MAGKATEQSAVLLGQIERIGPLAECEVVLPGGGPVYRIRRPTDIDRLLDDVADDPEQNLPYWAELWPSGIALAAAIAREPDRVRGQRVFELGSGLGVTAIAALHAGADLVVADYAPESLVLTRANALRNAGREPVTLQVNWRAPSQALLDLAGPGFPVVLAADVLYEGRDIDPLLALLRRLVRPGGLLWLAEPGRPVATRFLAAAAEAGWTGPAATFGGPWPDPKDEGIVVTVHQLRAPAG